jgi:hypothetical protein
MSINYICAKASKRLYAIRLLKRSGVSTTDLTRIYCEFIHPIREYACQVWHFSLAAKLFYQLALTNTKKSGQNNPASAAIV